MSGFQRPGSKQKSAFGISFEADRDTDVEPAAAPINLQSHLALQEQRKRLPIAKCRKELLYLVETRATTIIVGETGCGKTTQIPQFLHESGWTAEGRKIACTQPRRIAAMTVAARVAEEIGCTLGQQVGYSIRFEEVSTPGLTCIKYCTDGVLLREMMDDPLLGAYSVVMIDEAHERSLHTDILLGLLKKVQKRRPDLRVIVASATLQAQKLADFFYAASNRKDTERQPALLSVEGRNHEVQVHFLAEAAPDYIKEAVRAATELHCGDLPGDILVFLTGQEECDYAVELLEEEGRRVRRRKSDLKMFPMPLYAGLPYANQLQALESAPRGYRKIVVATNIAETSLTIPGIVFVIDSCFAKHSLYDPMTGLQSLAVGPISKASARQRAGRAGRLRPGHCIRLCTEDAYTELEKETVPEMQRSELSGVVMQLKALGIDNIMNFDFLSSPPAEAMIRALELLHTLGAIGDDARLTPTLGVRMAELPLDPRLGRALLASVELGCSEEISAVAAIMSVQSIWFAGQGQAALAAAKAKFAVAEGDLITYLNVWEAWRSAGEQRPSWAHQNCLNHRTLLRAADIKSQLCSHLRRMGFEIQSAEGDVEKVMRSLAHGLIANAAYYEVTEALQRHHLPTDIYRLVHDTSPESRPQLRIHSHSVVFGRQPPLVLYWQVQQAPKGFYDLQDLLVVEKDWLPEIAPKMYELQRRQLPNLDD